MGSGLFLIGQAPVARLLLGASAQHLRTTRIG